MLQPNENFWYFHKNQPPPPYNSEHAGISTYPASNYDCSSSVNQVHSQNEQYQNHVNWNVVSQVNGSNIQGKDPSSSWTSSYTGYANFKPSSVYDYQKTTSLNYNKNFPAQYQQPQSQSFMEVHSNRERVNYGASEMHNNSMTVNTPRIRVRDVFSLNNSIGNGTSHSIERRNEVVNTASNILANSNYSNVQTDSFQNVNNTSNAYPIGFENPSALHVSSNSFQQTNSSTVVWRPQYSLPNARSTNTNVTLNSNSLNPIRNTVNSFTTSDSLRSTAEKIPRPVNYSSMPALESNALVNTCQPVQQTNQISQQYIPQTSRSNLNSLLSNLHTVLPENRTVPENGRTTNHSFPNTAQPNTSLSNFNIQTSEKSNSSNIPASSFPSNFTKITERDVNLNRSAVTPSKNHSNVIQNSVIRDTRGNKTESSVKFSENASALTCTLNNSCASSPDQKTRNEKAADNASQQSEFLIGEFLNDIPDVKVPFDEKLLIGENSEAKTIDKALKKDSEIKENPSTEKKVPFDEKLLLGENSEAKTIDKALKKDSEIKENSSTEKKVHCKSTASSVELMLPEKKKELVKKEPAESPLINYKSKIDREKLDLLIEFLEGSNKAENYNRDVSKKRKSNKNSASNHNAETKVSSSKNSFDSSRVLDFRENAKKLEKTSQECERPKNEQKRSTPQKREPEMKSESLELSKGSNDSSEREKLENSKKNKKSEKKLEDSKKNKKSEKKLEMFISEEEVKIINIIREILKVQSHFCQSCNLSSPIGSVWINPVSRKVKCLNCFKILIKCKNSNSENKNVDKDSKNERPISEERRVSVSNSKKRPSSICENNNVENTFKKAKFVDEIRDRKNDTLKQNSFDNFYAKSVSKEKSFGKDNKKENSKDSRDFKNVDKKSLEKHDKRKSSDSKHEEKVTKTKCNRETETGIYYSLENNKNHQKYPTSEIERKRRKMLEKLHKKTKKLSWALLKEP